MGRHSIVNDKTPLPPPAVTLEEDEARLQDYPWIEGPVRMDYGYNVKSGQPATRPSGTRACCAR